MADTISIRFDERMRLMMESEAKLRGIGISTLVRNLAEAELRRVRRTRIYEGAEAVAAYLTEKPNAWDDDDPNEWFTMPDVTARIDLLPFVGKRVALTYEGDDSPSRIGLLRRVPEQGNCLAIGQRLISEHQVKAIEERPLVRKARRK